MQDLLLTFECVVADPTWFYDTGQSIGPGLR